METVNKTTISKANKTIMVPKIIKGQICTIIVVLITWVKVVEIGITSILRARISNKICKMSSHTT